MKKILKNDARTGLYLYECPKIYVTACWGQWGVEDYSFSGKWKTDADGICYPLVWVYDDHNGLTDQYELRDIRTVTSALIADWSFNRSAAEKLAKELNEEGNLNF